MPIIRPDRYLTRISRVDVHKDLLERGKCFVILDVDNTVLTRDTHEVPADVQAWLDEARAAGVKMCLLSNNFHHGVFDLAERLDLPIVAKAVKPLPFGFIRARKTLGSKCKNTMVIGDQLLTDVWGAHFTGMKAIMLRPLVKADLKHTLILRNVERVIMGKRLPEDYVPGVTELV